MKNNIGTILIVDDEKLICWSLSEELTSEQYQTITAGTVQEALAKVREYMPDLVILDVRLPDGTGIDALAEIKKIHPDIVVIMLSADDRSTIVVQAMKLGAFDYLSKPVKVDILRVIIEKAFDTIRLKQELILLYHQQSKEVKAEIISRSRTMKTVLDFIDKVGPTKSTVLITGESGTGKELVAAAIHEKSTRKNRPMVAINCGAIPDSLIETELFGHELGAFTDAVTQKKGLFEIATGSTVFLDEIGDISPVLQVKLLRILEEKMFRRVGGTVDIPTDVRIIAATNQDLEKKMMKNSFRSDLFYRLNVASITMPPLRDREDDILLLTGYFIGQFNQSYHKNVKGLNEKTKKYFKQYQWPGNVRELRNTIERAMILDDGEYIISSTVEDGLPHRLSISAEHQESDTQSLFTIEKEAIVKALEKTNYNQVQTARLLNISRDTLRYRMKKYGLFQTK